MRMWGKGSPRAVSVGMQSDGCGHVDSGMEGPKKAKHRIATRPHSVTSEYVPQIIEAVGGTFAHPHSQQMKLWPIHTMEDDSALKREEIPTPAASWVSLTLSEAQDTKRQALCDSTYMTRIVRVVETRSRMAAGKGGGGEWGAWCLTGTVSVWEDREVPKTEGAEGWPQQRENA